MKYFKKILVPLLSVLLVSACTSDDENTPDRGVVVTTLDFNTTILDNLEFGDVVGNIKGRTNIGLVSFEIISQTPEGALSIDEIVGELTVANPDIIDASVNPEIVLTVTVKNGDVSKNSNITIAVEAAPVDNDGDGIFSDTDQDDNDPCVPSQLPNYTDFDETNPIWMAADCDGDGDTNGDEIANGTNPYESATCDSMVDTDIWSGPLAFKDEVFGDVYEYNSNPNSPPIAGCGFLFVSDPLDYIFNYGPCADTDTLDITLTFEPDFDGATEGTVSVTEQDYTCDFLVSTFTATGTYDELTETIILNYTVDEEGDIFDGILTITTVP
ncbi:cadherin repeat domain-containing protein [Flavivirga abyssicola]|uniref:cadherin repeat domain-containing protein n=1 Tax=Flavivirga abyssicola TaxID=3063533 RepID=UPI0026DF2A3A|nr:cadherin repeat domain-containing protein [Flavivirga sp. MEBiC07777]WVK12638.1 cadherin repeat domain-containing protein [Flavivirga sp. MEBiC07777]